MRVTDSNSISHCDLELLTYTENGLSFNVRHLTEGFKHQACSWKSHWETTGELQGVFITPQFFLNGRSVFLRFPSFEVLVFLGGWRRLYAF